METTRHFVATMYVVNQGATALHHHERLDLWLPPGGHRQREELPHETALRETREETGLSVELLQSPNGPRSETVRPLPQPAHLLLEDITVHGGEVGHQHIDFIFFGRSTSRTIEPTGMDEQPAASWEWFGPRQLREDDRLPEDVSRVGLEAIETAQAG